MTSEEYAKAMLLVRRYWQNFKPVTGTFETWERMLIDLDVRYLVAAIDDLSVSHPEFPPGPGQLRHRAIELSQPHVPSADEALAEVYRQIGAIGHLGVPEWSHPAIGAAVAALGGWSALCASEEQMADRAHFLRIYATVEQRHIAEAVMPPSVAELLSAQVNLSAERALGPGPT